MDLFLLPKDVRCRIVCILLGAVKVDKDAKEVKSVKSKCHDNSKHLDSDYFDIIRFLWNRCYYAVYI